MASEQPSRSHALRAGLPMILANAVVPLAGVVDTAVIGAVGDQRALGGVALGTTVYNIAYFSLYFLRMSATALTAQARGAEEVRETQLILTRTTGWALAFGVLIVLAQTPLTSIGLSLFQAGAEVDGAARAYLGARLWGAPGALVLLGVSGWLIGSGRTREVLMVNAALSATNIALDFVFVLGAGLGVAGVGAATAAAETLAALMALAVAAKVVRTAGGWVPGVLSPRALVDPATLRRLGAINRDLMFRSWGMLVAIAWFTRSSASHGSAVLAGNHVLLQFVTLSAFVLDAWAFVAEAEVGRGVGMRSIPRIRRAVRVTSELAAASGCLLSAAALVFGPAVLEVLVVDTEARAAALRYLPLCAAIPLLGSAAWQLDGIMSGATRTRALRNAALASTATYVALDSVLTSETGTWVAFISFYAIRAGTLSLAYPGLEREVRSRTQPSKEAPAA